MSEWREVELGEVCQVGDGAHAKVERATSGVLYLTSKNFDRGKLKLDDVDFISEQDYEKLFDKKSTAIRRPQDGDVLMGIIGTFGNGYRYKSSDRFGVSSSVALLRPDRSLLDPDFLEYVVNSERFQTTHEAYGSGSVQGYTNIPTIKCIPVLLPPLSEQRRIAAVLSTLDAKIDLLRRQNATLEAIAQTLFAHWFVDFEFPDAQGCPYKSAGGSMQPSELGEIPVGWRLLPVIGIATFVNGAAFRQEDFSEDGSGLPIIKIVELKNGITSRTMYTKNEMNKGYYIDDGEILFSWSGSPETSIDIFLWALGEGILNQHTFKVLSRNDKERVWLFYQLKHLKPLFIHYAKQKQTTGLGHVTRSDLKEILVSFPDRLTLEQFNDLLGPVFQKYYVNLKSIRTLTALRDTLLPQLMSGQIRVC